jgi:acetylornithine deacetylase/succinyl-diaminopimelate desuccinylase-like protein
MPHPKKSMLSLITGILLFCCINAIAQQSAAKASMQAYEKYIDEKMDARIKEFRELVSIPSISSIPAHKADVAKAGAWIVQKLKSIGMSSAELIPTAGNPVVFGSWNKAPGKPTVIIYAHYDVQPVKEAEWDNPPFAPVVKDGRIFGRGASDDKSGVMTTIWAVETILAKEGKLPVNVKFMFEGSEEIGSPNFKEFLEQHKTLLKADFALNADDGQYNEHDPAITLSLRGAVQMEFTVKTANTDAHSGEFGGKTQNSVLAMAQIISSLYDKKGNIAVEGFYDKVPPITAAQKATIQKIPYDPAVDMKILGTTAEVGDPAYSPLERIWYRPTLEVVGMQGGYTAAEGHSNIIPGNAMARITCRLVGQQDGKEIVDLIVKHIKKNCPAGVTLSFKLKEGYARPMSFPADTKEYKYIEETLTGIYGKKPLQLGTGGSVGALLSIKESLGLLAYPLGFELSDEKWHAANEFFRISSMRRGQLIYCYYLQHLAEEEGKMNK